MFTNADVKMTLGLSIIGSITVTILIIVNKFWKQHLRKLILEGERAFDSNGWRKNDFEIRKPQFITKYFLKLPSNLKQIFCHATFWIITLGDIICSPIYEIRGMIGFHEVIIQMINFKISFVFLWSNECKSPLFWYVRIKLL